MRSEGMIVHTMAEVYADREQFVEDAEWLQRAGEEGWIVITKDKRIRRRPAELDAIATHGVRAFVISSADLTGVEQARRVVAHRGAIEEIARRGDAVVCVLEQRRVVQVWPRTTS